MKKYLFILITISVLFSTVPANAMWIIWQKSTGEVISNTGTQSLNGVAWVPPKATVLKNTAKSFGIPLTDLDAYLVEDTNTTIIDQMFDGEKKPKLSFDTTDKPIGVIFRENIKVKRIKRINEIQSLSQELKELISIETTYALDLTSEKQDKVDRIQKLKEEIKALSGQ